MKLYEVSQEIANCVRLSDSEAVDITTGEVINIDYLEQLEMEKDKKIENIIKFYKNCLADAKAYKEEYQRLQKLSKTAENKAEQLKAYLGFCLNGEKFRSEDGLHQVSFRRSESVDVIDVKALPENYLRYKDPEPDKTAIKEVLKSGVAVPGAVLVEKQNVSIK